MNYAEQRTLPLSPQKGLKTQNGRFSSKSVHPSKKICYKVSLCENRQRQRRKAFIGLTIRIMSGEYRLPALLAKTDPPCSVVFLR